MRFCFGRWIAVIGLVGCIAFPACNKAQPKETPVQEELVPTDPLEFRRYLIKEHPQEMAATMCQCCNKSLRQCYDETLTPGVRGCPDT